MTRKNTSDIKRCSICGVEKPVSAYYKNRGRSRGISCFCIECKKKRDREFIQTEKHHDQMLRRRYGITLQDYNTMLAKQGGGCAICGAISSGRKTKLHEVAQRFHVDHNHATGQIRGLLCHQCNVICGFAKDDVTRLRSAITYLSRCEV
jgi:hypothetical protein